MTIISIPLSNNELLTFSLEDAREVYAQLKEIFENSEQMSPVVPYIPAVDQGHQPWGPIPITCGKVGTTSSASDFMKSGVSIKLNKGEVFS